MKVHKLEELIHRTNSLMTLALLSFLMPLQKFYFYFCEMSYAVAVEKTICWLAHLLSIRLGSKCHCLLVGFWVEEKRAWKSNLYSYRYTEKQITFGK